MATGTAALSLIERIENLRTQAFKLLSGADAYDMATTIRDRVADTLKFFDDLGPLFRNGTLATYMCMVSVVARQPHAVILRLHTPFQLPRT